MGRKSPFSIRCRTAMPNDQSSLRGKSLGGLRSSDRGTTQRQSPQYQSARQTAGSATSRRLGLCQAVVREHIALIMHRCRRLSRSLGGLLAGPIFFAHRLDLAMMKKNVTSAKSTASRRCISTIRACPIASRRRKVAKLSANASNCNRGWLILVLSGGTRQAQPLPPTLESNGAP